MSWRWGAWGRRGSDAEWSRPSDLLSRQKKNNPRRMWWGTTNKPQKAEATAFWTPKPHGLRSRTTSSLSISTRLWHTHTHVTVTPYELWAEVALQWKRRNWIEWWAQRRGGEEKVWRSRTRTLKRLRGGAGSSVSALLSKVERSQQLSFLLVQHGFLPLWLSHRS